MLLAEILKATHTAHPHHARLSLALSMVTETAHIVNEAVTTRTRARVCGGAHRIGPLIRSATKQRCRPQPL
jgi:hypothetical protein